MGEKRRFAKSGGKRGLSGFLFSVAWCEETNLVRVIRPDFSGPIGRILQPQDVGRSSTS